MTIPATKWRVNGLELEGAPRWLVPYLDCCDGAVLLYWSENMAIVELHRSGQHVGTVSIEFNP